MKKMEKSCTPSTSSGDENNLEKAAAFMGGFVFLFPLYVVVNFSSFAVTRFHLPPDKIPLFINKFFSSMQICCLIGMLIMCGCVLVFKDKMNYISIVSMFLLFISIFVLWRVYNSGGQLGRLTLYYWTVNLVGFVVGLNNISISAVATKGVLFVTFGRTMSGIVIVIYQMTVYYTCLRLRVHNIGFWMYNLFMVILLMASLTTAIVWTVAFFVPDTSCKCCCCCKNCEQSCKRSCKTPCDGGQESTCCQENKCCCCCKNGPKAKLIKYKCLFTRIFHEYGKILNGAAKVIYGYLEERYHCTTETTEVPLCNCCCCRGGDTATCKSTEGGSGDTDNIKELKDPKVLSAFFMFPISMIITYAFNPAIAPYQFLGIVDGYKVSLFVTGVSCIPAIVFIIIEYTCKDKAPNNRWDNGLAYYHWTWVTILPMLLSAFICLIMLHYPDCPLSRKFYKSKFLIFLLSVTFLFGNDICITVGLAGVTHQGSESKDQGKGSKACTKENEKKKSNGVIAAVNLCLSYLVMVISMFISDGYLKTYRKYDRDYWPTKGYTRYRGFKFWFTAGLKEAGKTVRNSFTLDIRLQFTRHMV